MTLHAYRTQAAAEVLVLLKQQVANCARFGDNGRIVSPDSAETIERLSRSLATLTLDEEEVAAVER